MQTIIRHLDKRNAGRLRSDKPYTAANIYYILENEMYVGDRKLQKEPHTDYKTKKPKEGEEYTSYYVEGDHECCPYVNTMNTPKKSENRAFLGDLRMHTPVISIEKNVKPAPCLHKRVCKSGAVFYFAYPVLCI